MSYSESASRRSLGIIVRSVALSALALIAAQTLVTQDSAIISIDIRAATPIQRGFSGINDPSIKNTPTNPTAVTVQSGNSANPVTVPPYSVMRVDVTRHQNLSNFGLLLRGFGRRVRRYCSARSDLGGHT